MLARRSIRYNGSNHGARHSDGSNCAAWFLGRCLSPGRATGAAAIAWRGEELGARQGAGLRLCTHGRREAVQHADHNGPRRLCDAAGARRVQETQDADHVYGSPAGKRVRALTRDKDLGGRLPARPPALIVEDCGRSGDAFTISSTTSIRMDALRWSFSAWIWSSLARSRSLASSTRSMGGRCAAIAFTISVAERFPANASAICMTLSFGCSF